MSVPAVTHPAAPVEDGSLIRLPRLSVAAMALVALFVVGLALRLAELDGIPLDEREVVQALAAWNLLNPREALALHAPESPLLFALQTLLFGLFGANELTARLPVALAGAALPFAPLLLRNALGRERSLAFCLLLAASPLLLMASRQSHAVVLSLLPAVLMLLGLLRFYQTRRQGHAMLATLAAAMLVLLGDAGGLLLALQLYLALLLTRSLQRPEGRRRGVLSSLRQWSRTWPLAGTLPPALLAVFLIATLFMLHPQGLANVGELLSSLVTGFGDMEAGLLRSADFPAGAQTASEPAAPFGFLQRRLNLILLYEPFVVVAGLLWFWLRGRRRPGPVDRFLFIWLLAALASLFLWRGAGPAHTLWLIMPLAGLAGGMLAEVLAPRQNVEAWPAWATALAAALSFCLAALFSFYARLLLRDRVDETTPLLVLALLPPVALILLRRGGRSALLRGSVAGAGAFILLLSLGGGWATVVVRADEADGLWRGAATSPETRALRDALQDLANQEAGGFAGLEVHAWKGERTLLRWLLRDYSRLQFVDGARDAAAADILLLPASEAPPAGNGAWIGQEFDLRQRRVVPADNGPGGFNGAGATSRQARDSLVLLLRGAGPEARPAEAAEDGAA